ncbi:MAG: hypothetical protein ACR2PL_07515 [Dehalococcoidia bacterium]
MLALVAGNARASLTATDAGRTLFPVPLSRGTERPSGGRFADERGSGSPLRDRAVPPPTAPHLLQRGWHILQQMAAAKSGVIAAARARRHRLWSVGSLEHAQQRLGARWEPTR